MVRVSQHIGDGHTHTQTTNVFILYATSGNFRLVAKQRAASRCSNDAAERLIVKKSKPLLQYARLRVRLALCVYVLERYISGRRRMIYFIFILVRN